MSESSPVVSIPGSELVAVLVPSSPAPADPGEDPYPGPAGATYDDVVGLLRRGSEFVAELVVPGHGYLVLLLN